jgi:redox-sensitive bicupin YhaK (pirin superfamily)
LEGDLAHQDSMGNQTVIKHGDIQVMSAGTGVKHSEMNHNKDKPVKFLQIWVMPNQKNVTPRYDQITLDPTNRINTLQQILSPNADDAGVWIHQDAWFHIGKFDLDFTTNYKVKKAGNGMYAFVLYGSFELAGQKLEERDALGITDFDQFELKALTKDAEILLMEIPMQLA